MFTPPQTEYFIVFGFPIYYYGIILAFAILTGVIVSNHIAQKHYYMPNIIPDIATGTIISGIIGARLYYCLLNLPFYMHNPLDIFAIRQGGLSIHGAILGGAAALFFYSKKHNIKFLKLCDIVSVGLPLAQAIGRWGNFYNSEAFGLPTNLPWKMFISPLHRPEKYITSDYFHPTFLYESVFDFIIFIFLYKIALNKYKDKSGIITCYYLILYSIVRFFIESLRVDCTSYIMGLPTPQFISLLIIIFLSLYSLFQIYLKH